MRLLITILCVLLVPIVGGCVSSRPVEIGRSVLGEPLTASDLVAGRTGPRVYVIGLIHGNEPEGMGTLDAIREASRGRGIRVRIVDSMNPDGHFAGTRGNARAIDLNRNWPASNFSPAADRGAEPLSEPETRAVFEDLNRFGPDVLVVLHSIRRGGPFVNFDGPPPAGVLAKKFAEAAAMNDPRWRVVPSMGYPTPGSLGSFAGGDLAIPTLTIEFERGHDPELARDAARAGFGAVLDAIAGPGRPPYR
jgi:hypothetical protein